MHHMSLLLVAVGVAANHSGLAQADEGADRPAPLQITLKVVSTSNPRAGIILTTDESPPDTHGGTPVVRISRAEADAVLAFLRKTGLLDRARSRREVCWAPERMVALHVNHAGVMRTQYSGVSLQALGYVERLSDTLSPAVQHQVLATVDRIKEHHYRSVQGRDVIPLWLSQSRKMPPP